MQVQDVCARTSQIIYFTAALHVQQPPVLLLGGLILHPFLGPSTRLVRVIPERPFVKPLIDAALFTPNTDPILIIMRSSLAQHHLMITS